MIRQSKLKVATAQSQKFAKVSQYILHVSPKQVPANLVGFEEKKEKEQCKLYDGPIIYKNYIVIPNDNETEILKFFYVSHQGNKWVINVIKTQIEQFSGQISQQRT